MWLLRGVGLLSLGESLRIHSSSPVEWATLGGLAATAAFASWLERRYAKPSTAVLVLAADYALVAALLWAMGGVAWAYWLLTIPMLNALWRGGALGAYLSAPLSVVAILATSFLVSGNWLPRDGVALSWLVGLSGFSLLLGWLWQQRPASAQTALLQQATRALEQIEVTHRELHASYRELVSRYRRLEEHLVALQDATELLSALHQVRDPEATYTALLERLQARFDASGAALLVPDEAGTMLLALSAIGTFAPLQSHLLPNPTRAAANHTQLPQLMHSLLEQLCRVEPLVEAHSTPLNPEQLMGQWLTQSGRLLGAIVFAAQAETGFDSGHQARLRALVPYLVGLLSLLEQLRLIANRLAETQLLYEIESLVFSTDTVQSLLQRVLNLLKTVLPYEHGQIVLRQGEMLEIVAQVGGLPDLRPLLGNTLSKQAQIWGATHTWAPNFAPARTLMLAPLHSGMRVEGAVILGRTDLPAFNELELELLQTLAFQITSILKRAHLLSDLERLATTDGLTGLYNYRHFQERYREEVNRCRRYQHPMAIMLIDLDGFKQVNDQYGHLEGDYLLVQLAEVLQHTLRNTELVARYGGDEFVVMMPFTNLQGAVAAAERVAHAVRNTTFLNTLGQPCLKISVSIGVAAYPNTTENPAELLEKADEALEIAKRGGRNQVVALENSA